MKQIPSCPGYYASTDGFIFKNGRQISAAIHSNGYLRFAAFIDQKRVNRYVHHCVAEAYLGPRPTGLHTRHIDGCATNNSVGNLAYGSCQDNCDDRLKHGTRPRGSRVYNSALTDFQVLGARTLMQHGLKRHHLAKALNVSRSCIGRAVCGETYSYLPGTVQKLERQLSGSRVGARTPKMGNDSEP